MRACLPTAPDHTGSSLAPMPGASPTRTGSRGSPHRPEPRWPIRSRRARRSAGRAVDPGCEHDFTPVWVLVGNAAIGLPVVDLRDGVDARGGQPGGDALLGGG